MHEGSLVQAVIENIDEFLGQKAPFDSLLARFFKLRRYIGSSDRRTIAELAYGLLRSYSKIEFINHRITNKHARFAVITYLVVEKKYGKQKLEAIFNGKEHAPGRLCEFEHKFIDKLLNANFNYPKWAMLNYPEWLEPRLKAAFIENFDQELKAMNQPACVDLRVNLLKTTVDVVLTELKQSNFKAEKTKISPVGIRIHGTRLAHANKILSNGLAEIQDEGSQIIALECLAKANDTVIDLCAGTGGKTMAIAACMNNKGRIYATDNNEARLERAKLRIRNAGISNVYCNLLTGKWMKRHAEVADIVLVDAPCSGSGTWRRNPDMRFRLSEDMIVELTAKQREILDNAKKLVKVGGRLVYATCSIFVDENEDQVKWFLSKNPDFEIEAPNFITTNKDWIKMSPYKTETDGFFCVKFIRRA